MRAFVFLFTLFSGCILQSHLIAQSVIIRDIKSFGARGDGRTNDHAAFQKAAAFFNERGGNGKLKISKGIYLVGNQIIDNGKNEQFNWKGQDVLHFTNVRNFTIEGSSGAVLRYRDAMKYGSFDPASGHPRKGNGYFVDSRWAASLGHCIFIDKSQNIAVKDIELDGNNDKIILGGGYGDVGYQLPHYGIFIQNSKGITIQNVNSHHFGLDGICVANIKTGTADNIKILDSKFNYNARQGFSWIGGNGVYARNCQFNHTGKGKFYSPPGAGLDIEAEYGPNQNGVFENCEFINATGCCMVADGGDSRNMTFNNCTFWSSTTWSIWTTKPGFTFTACKIYGPIVHGYDSPNDQDATKFIRCQIEDKPYNGQQPSGAFLIESNDKRRVRFENCTLTARYKKLFWFSAPVSWQAKEKYQLINCKFISMVDSYPTGDFIGVLRGAYYKNTTMQYRKKYYITQCCETSNVDGGGNKMIATD
ncbi:right-handed parallel beta-helix repeat-containing protein [Niabella sp.]|uniref:right-handed parallel beta-helix repeat-containing protein n=1 Tax=Niabella sp. TaxID=1962976 RepID=UPI0026219384|nr:right-handed parallel beta-helix repeat-containing protein [Niabella sp.]